MAQTQDEFKDLGFGSVVASESRGRMLNRDGSFNVRREGLHPLESLSIYHYLLTTSWSRFLALVCVAYVVINGVFAAAFVLCGPGALTGTLGAPLSSRIATSFFFSVHTLATIGYGSVAPLTLAANLVVTVESLAGLLGFALATGLVFSRFSRPVAAIVYSRTAVIAPYRAGTAFMFRLVNVRMNQLVDVAATVSLSRRSRRGDGTREFFELPLERTRVVLFPLSWTVVHPINEQSPLWGVTERELHDSDAEFLVVLTAIDETFSQQVHSRTSYKPREVVFGARFSNILRRSATGPVSIDVSHIHDYERVQLPDMPMADYTAYAATEPAGFE